MRRQERVDNFESPDSFLGDKILSRVHDPVVLGEVYRARLVEDHMGIQGNMYLGAVHMPEKATGHVFQAIEYTPWVH